MLLMRFFHIHWKPVLVIPVWSLSFNSSRYSASFYIQNSLYVNFVSVVKGINCSLQEHHFEHIHSQHDLVREVLSFQIDRVHLTK